MSRGLTSLVRRGHGLMSRGLTSLVRRGHEFFLECGYLSMDRGSVLSRFLGAAAGEGSYSPGTIPGQIDPAAAARALQGAPGVQQHSPGTLLKHYAPSTVHFHS